MGAKAAAALLAALVLPACGGGAAPAAQRTEPAVGHPTFLSPQSRPIAVSGGLVFVANTPADTVDVIDATTRAVVARVAVGIDPVSVAVRPDGREVWVANHVSDSVSVIDTASLSARVPDRTPIQRGTITSPGRANA